MSEMWTLLDPMNLMLVISKVFEAWLIDYFWSQHTFKKKIPAIYWKNV